MSAESDALNAAAAQLLALLGDLRKSNMQILHGADSGAPDRVIVHPTPNLPAWSDDALIVVDIVAPNVTAQPTLQVSDLPAIPIVWANGQAIRAGDVCGVSFFKIHGSPQTGYAAQILSRSAPPSAALIHDATLTGDGAANPLSVAQTTRAWGIYRAGALVSSRGVAAVSRLSQGNYRIDFSKPMPSLNYGVHGGLIHIGVETSYQGLGGWLSQTHANESSSTSVNYCTIACWGLYLGLPYGTDLDFSFAVRGD